jgi:vesicle-fusing ATPase
MRVESIVDALIKQGQLTQIQPGLLQPLSCDCLPQQSKIKLSDVLLMPQTKRQVEIALARIQKTERLAAWKVADSLQYGKGVTLSFSGNSGNGKTMLAHALAYETGKPIICVKLGALMSKYVGDTEKHIEQAFATAAKTDAVLFFDESDALAFSRSMADQSWQIAMINTMLHELENFDGVCIFSSNLAGIYDPAFARRLTMHIEFPDLTENQVRQVIEGLIPPEARAIDVDMNALRLQGLSAGDVKNIAINAAGIAAADNADKIGQKHLLEALELSAATKRQPRQTYLG